MSKPNRILELDPMHLREIDGVVLDSDSYARHVSAPQEQAPLVPDITPPAPQKTEDPVAEEPPSAAPAPVFAVDPVHIGWYEPGSTQEIRYPIMAGAIAPNGMLQGMQAIPVYGSCSGSYLSSYTASFSTSFLTSWMTSFLYGSGSWMSSYLHYLGSGYLGSGSFGSGSSLSSAFFPGGFGLELI